MAIDQLASMSFKTEFAVDMTCQSCVDDVKRVLEPMSGVEEIQIDLEKKQVVVTGRAPPSIVGRALKDTGRQVLIRGSGSASGTHEGAAVAILETPLPAVTPTDPNYMSQQVHGIARMVQVSTSPVLMLLDLTVRFPTSLASSSTPASAKEEKESYEVYVAKTGDITSPPSTTGGVHTHITTLSPDEEGYADAFLELPIGLWDVIGRALIVEPSQPKPASPIVQEGLKGFRKGRLGILAGVIARSAGAWGNEKTVCACSGATMWEEGRMMEARSKI